MPVPLNLVLDPGMPPLEPIILADINTLRSNFENSLLPGSRETRSGWVSVTELMALINDNKATGIRIYLGRHDRTDTLYPGQLNMILVTTIDQKNPDAPETETSEDQLNAFPGVGPVNTVSYSGKGGDRVPLCPPRCS